MGRGVRVRYAGRRGPRDSAPGIREHPVTGISALRRSSHPRAEYVYRMLGHRGRFLRRWKMAGEAERLNAMRLDVRELTERADNSIKFLSDMFYARAYRMAANRGGVPDYRN